MPAIDIVEADLSRADHQAHVLLLTAAYAEDPMGNGAPLSEDVLDRLIPGLRDHPTTLVFLAYASGQPVGLATCFRGFSTFFALPVINIADLAVLPEYRRRGVGRELIGAVERTARESGCCRITLDVQEKNTAARRLYDASGFSQAVYGEETGGSLYYWKIL